MLTIAGNTLAEVFANLSGHDALDSQERATARKIADWSDESMRCGEALNGAVNAGDRDAWEAACEVERRLRASRPFVPHGRGDVFSLVCDGIRFTIRPCTDSATMNVGIDRA